MIAVAASHATQSTSVLDRLADRALLTDLVYQLAAALDEHRFEDLADLFTADASVRSPGGEATGRPAVVHRATANHSGYSQLQHRFTNILADPGVDEASVRADVVARLGSGNGAGVPSVALGAVYRMLARRTPEGWRLSRLEITPVWRVDS